MDGVEYLSTTAEVAAALAGFSALAVVLRQSRSEEIPSRLISTLIERSLVAMMLSLLPLPLLGLQVPEAIVWLTSSGVLGCYIASLAWRGVTIRRQDAVAAAMVSGPAFVAAYGIGIVVLVLQFANALGVAVQQGLWWYLIGLVWLIGTVCLFFFIVVRIWARAA